MARKFSSIAWRNLARQISTSRTCFASDFYAILGVKPTATQAEIKMAYFELSKLYHPDKNVGSADNITKFRHITTAYEVLGNVEKRRLYDKGVYSFPEGTAPDQAAGEKKRVDVVEEEEEEEEEDPLARFYRKRESLKKLTQEFSTYTNEDAWTKSQYEQVRQRQQDMVDSKKNKLSSKPEYNTALIAKTLIFGVIAYLCFFGISGFVKDVLYYRNKRKITTKEDL